MTNSNIEGHWKKSKNLMFAVLAVWFFFGYVLQFFVGSLNNISFFGFPLGYYMAAQGSLFAFVVILFVFASKQNAIDKEFGLAEENNES